MLYKYRLSNPEAIGVYYAPIELAPDAINAVMLTHAARTVDVTPLTEVLRVEEYPDAPRVELYFVTPGGFITTHQGTTAMELMLDAIFIAGGAPESIVFLGSRASGLPKIVQTRSEVLKPGATAILRRLVKEESLLATDIIQKTPVGEVVSPRNNEIALRGLARRGLVEVTSAGVTLTMDGHLIAQDLPTLKEPDIPSATRSRRFSKTEQHILDALKSTDGSFRPRLRGDVIEDVYLRQGHKADHGSRISVTIDGLVAAGVVSTGVSGYLFL